MQVEVAEALLFGVLRDQWRHVVGWEACRFGQVRTLGMLALQQACISGPIGSPQWTDAPPGRVQRPLKGLTAPGQDSAPKGLVWSTANSARALAKILAP
jgi:hypothetical protein